MTNQWQYKIQAVNKFELLNSIEVQINDFAKSGWELVTMLDSPELFKAYDKQTSLFLVLKKPLK
jgi:hypothetical protein